MPPRKKTNRRAEAIEFGRRLRDMRLTRGWTQEQLAEYANLNELQIGHIERGASDVKLSTILKLAAALGVPADELMGTRS